MSPRRVGALPLAVIPTAPWDPFFANQMTIADFGAAGRPFGIAAGDFDGDGKVDVVIGRVTGNVAFVKGNGDGTFAAPVALAWKQTTFNAWSFAAGDVNGDGKLDLIWGANAPTSGCTVSPPPTTGCPSTQAVNDGDVRVFFGNGNGTFVENTYFVNGVRHNAGTLLARPGTADAGSLAAGDIDGDGDLDIVAGAVDGTNSVVKILRNDLGVFNLVTLVSQPTACATPCSPIYFPAISAQNSPWGLSLADADGDGDADLWVGDRAMYVYLYRNNGAGAFTLQGNNSAVSGRPNVYLGHDSLRASVGFTGSLGSGDINGDGRADLAIGLQVGAQTPASATAHDGEILLDVSSGGTHTGFGSLADIGAVARGVTVIDVNGDGYRDIIASEYDGKVKLLRQLPPLDSDGDAISDYVDNAPYNHNPPRVDMNTDGTINYKDQLDNDSDTVLGDPENQGTWQRLGDAADPDDDNDGAADGADNCPFAANADQADVDADGIGNVCDPLDDRDTDNDDVPNGPVPGDPTYAAARAASIKWSTGKTHFVIRIDALGRFFQNEFTQLMTDAAILSPSAWQAKCWENYQPDDIINGSSYEPCGTGEGTPVQTLTLQGGKGVPVTLVVIPKQLWTDPPVIAWINDRNDNQEFELGQHGTYHVNNIPRSDWKDQPDRNFFSCELCGLSVAENYQLMKVGTDTLLGNYSNKWIMDSGALPTSPRIDWASSAHPLFSFAPPFNTSDTAGRQAVAQLGFKGFSASIFEEGDEGSYGYLFSPEGSHYLKFDQFGMYHASSKVELEPPETAGGTYAPAAYDSYLQSQTQPGGLNVWLIEEVEWSGRPCNDDPRLTEQRTDAPATCQEANGATSNRENNTVYQARWEGWMQLLDFVKGYPEGVVMTMDEVALAKSYDNAPTVANPDQADSDHDGIGDVIAGASISSPDALLSRNQAGTLSATLTNGLGSPIAAQTITFSFDADGDGTPETYTGVTAANGVATATVTATRAVGPATFSTSWDGVRLAANGSGNINVADASKLTLDAANPASGQVTDSVTVGATLTDSDNAPLANRSISFTIGTASGTGTTDSNGHATATLVLKEPAGSSTLQAQFAGGGSYASSGDSKSFTVLPEDTTLALADAVASKSSDAVARATLKEVDGAALAARTVNFYVEDREKGQTVYTLIGSASTNASGLAQLVVPTRYVSKSKRGLRAVFAGDASFLSSTANAFVYRN